MIIWRGWGILAFLFVGLFFVLPGSMLDTSHPQLAGIAAGLGGIIGAGLLWTLGVWLNKTRPRRVVDAHLAQRETAVRAAVENGTFAPGGIRPTSLDQARVQGEEMLASERSELSRLPAGHTLFFIPMQWFALPMAGVGVVMLVQTIARLVH